MKKAADQSAAFSLGRVLKRHRSNASVSVWLALSPTPRMGCARWPTFRYSPATQGATSHPRCLYGSSTRTIRNRTPISRRCMLFTRRVRASDSRSSSDSREILNQTLLRSAGILLWPPQSIDGLPNDLEAGNSRYIPACRSIAAASCFSGTPRISSAVSKDSARRRPPPCQGRSATSGPKMPYVES